MPSPIHWMRGANVLVFFMCLLIGTRSGVAQGKWLCRQCIPALCQQPRSQVTWSKQLRGVCTGVFRRRPPGAAASPPLVGHSPTDPQSPVPAATNPSPPVGLPPPAPPSPAPPVVYRNGPACALVAGPIDAPNGNNYLSGLPIWPPSDPRFPRFSYVLMTSTGQLSTIRYIGGAAWSIDGAGGNITRFEASTRRRAQEVGPSPTPAPVPAPPPAPGPVVALVLRSDGSFVFARADGSSTGVGSATLGVARAGTGGEANAPFTLRLLDFPGRAPSLDLGIYNKDEKLVWSLFGAGEA
eukprot:XP_001700742.1 predicted protein [Chlamydomonas reinhardtii]